MKNKKSKFFTCLIAFSFAFIVSCSQNEERSPDSFAISNVHIIDAASGLRQNQTVLVQKDKIVDVGPANSITIPKGFAVIDGKEKYLIPGLWDAHVHLTYEPQMTTSMFDLFLVNGITSVRDTGGELELVMPLKIQADAAPENSPRVKVAGPLLDGIPTVYDGVSRIKLGIGADSPAEAEKLVDQFIEAGVDLIKSYEMLTPESFSAVIARANSHGKVVTGHVPLSMDVIDASDQGLRSMEHMRNLEMSVSEDYDSLLKVRRQLLSNPNQLFGLELRSSIHAAQRIHAIKTEDDQRRAVVLQALHDNNTWQTPTLSIVTPRAFKPFAQPEWRDNFKYLPDSVNDTDGLRAHWNTLRLPLQRRILYFQIGH